MSRDLFDPDSMRSWLVVRVAMQSRQKLRIRYEKRDGEESVRVVRPLGAFFWGRSWTLTAWCELREDFRNFRLDRMSSIEPTGESFVDEPARSLREYLVSMGHLDDDVVGR
jgi:predicted DNA-binding transcriptional regulator YafY